VILPHFTSRCLVTLDVYGFSLNRSTESVQKSIFLSVKIPAGGGMISETSRLEFWKVRPEAGMG